HNPGKPLKAAVETALRRAWRHPVWKKEKSRNDREERGRHDQRKPQSRVQLNFPRIKATLRSDNAARGRRAIQLDLVIGIDDEHAASYKPRTYLFSSGWPGFQITDRPLQTRDEYRTGGERQRQAAPFRRVPKAGNERPPSAPCARQRTLSAALRALG